MLDALPIARLKDFIRSVPPLYLLSEDELEELVRNLLIEFFPKGEVILGPDTPPAHFLYIIRSGGVRSLLPEEGADRQEVTYDYRGEGDHFGYVSLLSGGPSPYTVVAEEDTFCYLVKKAAFNRLLDTHPEVFLHFTRSSLPPATQHVDEADLKVHQVLLMGRVRDVMKTRILTCAPRETTVEAARRMTEWGVSSAVVVDEGGIPIGMVTDGDFRSKVLARGRAADVPVSEIMTRPVRSIPPDAFCFEAVISMIVHRINYLPIVESARLIGIISKSDLMISEGNTPIALVKAIEQAKRIEDLVTVRDDIERMVLVLLQHGGMAKDMCELITGLNDQLTRKLIMIAEGALAGEGRGRPPVPYAWLALGSEGRREQTLRTDQDNALVFADSPGGNEGVQEYFLALAGKVVSGLEQCGFPRCKAGLMASNPKWCQPFKVWRERYRNWIVNFDLSPEETLETFIFFDCRPVYGQHDLATRLVGFFSEFLTERSGFLRDMAQTAILHETPLGFFQRLVVKKSGEHKDQLNLKLDGLTPLVDAVRTLALDQRIFETNTLARISALAKKSILTQTEADDLSDAFNVIVLARVRRHLEVIRQGKTPDNYVNPEDLTMIQRTMLREAFKTIDKLQKLLLLRYKLEK